MPYNFRKLSAYPTLEIRGIWESKHGRAENFHGGLVVKTLHFQCRRCEFHPYWGTRNHTCHADKKKKKRLTGSMICTVWGITGDMITVTREPGTLLR